MNCFLNDHLNLSGLIHGAIMFTDMLSYDVVLNWEVHLIRIIVSKWDNSCGLKVTTKEFTGIRNQDIFISQYFPQGSKMLL